MTKKRPQNCGTGYCSCIECPYEAEQAEQEPVAIDELARACNLAGIEYKDFLRIKAHLPIAAPVQQVKPCNPLQDLTDDEIATVYEQDEHHHGEFNYRFDLVSFARAVIAAYREKNK